MFFSKNSIIICIEDLQAALSGKGYIYATPDFYSRYLRCSPTIRINVKPWLHHIVLTINMMDEFGNLAEQTGLLLECPALQTVKVDLGGLRHRGDSLPGYKIIKICNAFKLVAEKFGQNLMFNVLIPGRLRLYERLIGDLDKLYGFAREEDWQSTG